MIKRKKALLISLISVIVILSLALTVSLIYNFIGGFYKSRITKFNKVLGEEQTIEIKQEGAYCLACNFSGITLLGVDLGQNILIKTKDIEGGINVRARAYVEGFSELECMLFGYSNWVVEDDGGIMLNQSLGANESIGLCKYVRLNEKLKLESNIDYILIIVIEAYK